MNRDFTMIPNKLLLDTSLNEVDKMVWLVLKYHAKQNQTCWPSLRTIAKEIKKSERTVERHMKKLQRAGWVVVTQRFNSSNIYEPLSSVSPAGDTTDTRVVTPMTPPPVMDDNLIRSNGEEAIEGNGVNKRKAEGKARSTDLAAESAASKSEAEHDQPEIYLQKKYGFVPQLKYRTFQEWFESDRSKAEVSDWLIE
jgi:DNA-binding transcriptional MocR family regulator